MYVKVNVEYNKETSIEMIRYITMTINGIVTKYSVLKCIASHIPILL